MSFIIHDPAYSVARDCRSAEVNRVPPSLRLPDEGGQVEVEEQEQDGQGRRVRLDTMDHQDMSLLDGHDRGDSMQLSEDEEQQHEHDLHEHHHASSSKKQHIGSSSEGGGGGESKEERDKKRRAFKACMWEQCCS